MSAMSSGLSSADFNSIKVRLIHYRLVRYKITDGKFQFHKGSIDTMSGNMYEGVELKFQFHKGSIDTDYLYYNFQHRQNFNSIKVRLIHPERPESL